MINRLENEWDLTLGRGLDYFEHYAEGTIERNQPSLRSSRKTSITCIQRLLKLRKFPLFLLKYIQSTLIYD